MKRTGTFTLAATILLIALSSLSHGEKKYTASDSVIRLAARKFPDASAVILLSRREHTFKIDKVLKKIRARSNQYGIHIKTEIKDIWRIKILSEQGIEKFGDYYSDIFNNKFKGFDLEASVTSPGGKKTKVSGDDIHRLEIGRYRSQYRIAFPGLEIGSVIEIREKTKVDGPVLAGRWDFGADVPVIRSEFVLTVPRGVGLRLNLMPKEKLDWLKPEIDGRYETYTITKEIIPSGGTEKFMPPSPIGNPTLNYLVWKIPNSVIEDIFDLTPRSMTSQPYVMNWKTVSTGYSAYFDPKSWESADKAEEYGAELDRIIFELKQNEPGGADSLLQSILDYFHDSFQPIDDDLFYSSGNPEETYVLREGGPWELAYVLNVLLKHSGFQTNIVLVRDADKGLLDRKTPNERAFNHALIRVEHNGKNWSIDPFNHYCDVDELPWMSRGVDGMMLKRDGKYGFLTIPLNPSSMNCFHSLTEAEIDQEGNLSCLTTFTMTGQYCLDLRRLCGLKGGDRLDEEISKLIESNYPDLYDEEEAFTMVKDTGDSIQVTFLYRDEGFADLSGNLMNIDFSLWTGGSLISAFETETRRHDIQFLFLRRESSDIRIRLPEGSRVPEPPSPGELSNDYLEYSRTVGVDGNTVRIRRSLTVKAPTIKVKDYQMMRQFTSEIYQLDSETIVLEL